MEYDSSERRLSAPGLRTRPNISFEKRNDKEKILVHFLEEVGKTTYLQSMTSIYGDSLLECREVRQSLKRKPGQKFYR